MSGHLRVIASVRSLYTEVIFMQSQVNFSYFYGEESEQFSYFRIPRLLVRSEKFKTLSTDAKLLYGLMLAVNSLRKPRPSYGYKITCIVTYFTAQFLLASTIFVISA